MLSYGDNSYGDGLIGFTILGREHGKKEIFAEPGLYPIVVRK